MRETPEEIQRMQRLLDESYEKSGAHLKLDHHARAAAVGGALCAELPGMTLLALATVTARCEPIVGPVDGMLFHGRFWFGSAENSVRFRHIRAQAGGQRDAYARRRAGGDRARHGG